MILSSIQFLSYMEKCLLIKLFRKLESLLWLGRSESHKMQLEHKGDTLGQLCPGLIHLLKYAVAPCWWNHDTDPVNDIFMFGQWLLFKQMNPPLRYVCVSYIIMHIQSYMITCILGTLISCLPTDNPHQRTETMYLSTCFWYAYIYLMGLSSESFEWG